MKCVCVFLVSLFLFTGCNSADNQNQFNTAEVIDKIISTGEVDLFSKSLGNGTPIVLVHWGPGFDHQLMFDYLKPLSDSYQLVAYDQRYSGKSSPQIDFDQLSLDVFTKDLLEVVNAYGFNEVILIGHSWGGLIAMNFASEYPELVTSMVLISSAGLDSSWFIPFNEAVDGGRTADDIQRLGEIMNSEAFQSADHSTMSDFAEVYMMPYFHDRSNNSGLPFISHETTASNVLGIFGHMAQYLSSYDLSAKVNGMQTPILVIAGGESDPTPTHTSEKIAKSVSNAEFVVFQESGHFPFIEEHDRFLELVRTFLDSYK